MIGNEKTVSPLVFPFLSPAVYALCVLCMLGGFLLRFVVYAPPPLPAYRLEVKGDSALLQKQSDCAPSEVPLTLSSALELVLRPAHDVTRPVSVSAYLNLAGRVVRWPVEFQHAPSGTLRLRERADKLPLLSPGHVEVLLCVGYKTAPFGKREGGQLLRTRLHIF